MNEIDLDLTIEHRIMEKIKTIKNWQNMKSMEIARKLHITIEAVDITLKHFGYPAYK